ncbi:Forkhead box protein G1 [Mortierella sp. NVP41]|nr:Forkhead box protein G1 [Mortierella sp. NVP41]
MSQDYPERVGYHREDEAIYQQHQYRHSHQQQQQQQQQHQGHSGRPQEWHQDPRSERSMDRVPHYYHVTNTPHQPSIGMHTHHGSSATQGQFPPFAQPVRRSSHHHGGQEHQQQQHLYTSTRHHSMDAERASLSLYAIAAESASLTRGLPYGIPRISSSSSSLSVTGSLPASVHAAAAVASASTSVLGGSSVRSVPAGSATSSLTVTTTASGEIKTTRRRRRPNESYSTIIVKAIRSSPLQRLKLSEIYDYVSREIPNMDGNDKGWQNTVRHNLSHNKCFRRVVIKDEDPLPSGSADDDNGGESKQSTTISGKSSKQVKRGKGGCWVLVLENLDESMTSPRPKKSSMDQGQSPAAPAPAPGGGGGGGSGSGNSLLSVTSPKRQQQQQQQTSGTIISKTTAGTRTTSSSSLLTSQLTKDYSVSSHSHSGVMDIDRNVASMMIAEQQLHQSGRHHGPHMHPSYYNPPPQHPNFTSQSSHPHNPHQHFSYSYLLPHYPSSSSSSSAPSSMMMHRSGSNAFSPFSPTTPRPDHQQRTYSSSGDDMDHDSESDGGQSSHSGLSNRSGHRRRGRSNSRAVHEMDDDDLEEEEANPDAMENDSLSPSSYRLSPSPSTSSLSTSSSSPMDIEETEDASGLLSSSSSPTTGRRPGMSIQNMLN